MPLKLSDIRLSRQSGAADLRQTTASLLGIPERDVTNIRILKLSTDARRKPDVRFVHTLLVDVRDEFAVLRKQIPGVSLYSPPERYEFPSPGAETPLNPPVIVGTGPAGLFAALCLAEAGVRCIVLERGKKVDARAEDVGRFWSGQGFDAESNVQFGEGGAGTFSDGKLTTGVNDLRVRFVLERLVSFGAPEDILYLSKPHIGTDKLRRVAAAARERLIALGCEVRFGHKLVDIDVSGGALRGITVRHEGKAYTIVADSIILAPGNSARDTFEMLLQRGIRMSPKDFSVGVRIEHLQRDIDIAQYGQAVLRNPEIPASDYKLVKHLGPGRSVYSFCVCPGGSVVAAASEPGAVVTNGMSLYARDGENISGALLVSVKPDDFGHGPLDGVEFQRKLERAAFAAGGGDFYAPAQLVGDFFEKRTSSGHKKVRPTYMPGVRYCNLWDVLPEFICQALLDALPEFSRRVGGFASPDAVLTAVETRSSCPVRIDREDYETVGIRGVFPCGEGAGHAGGIMSAAVDGVRSAERVLLRVTGL